MIEGLDYRGKLTDSSKLVDRLAETGMDSATCPVKADLFAAAAMALPAPEPLQSFYVPGRIEVLGKHTDYAGGSSMVVAAQRGFCLVAATRVDRHVIVTDALSGETIGFDPGPELVPRVGHWSNYPMTVARRVARNFPEARRGVDIAFASDLPPAAGMSSSSAMMVAVFLALAGANGLADTPRYQDNIHNLTDLAGFLGTVENGQTFGSLEGDRGVGTFGGSEDHTAILCGRPNQISQYVYCPVCFERAIPLPAGYTFAVATSGVAAEKTGGAMQKYNAASQRAAAIAELWRGETGRDDPHLAAALANGPEAAAELTRIVLSGETDAFGRDELLARLEHFLTENEQLLPAAGDALAKGDLKLFGELVDSSQRAAEQLLGNQIPQTSCLAETARRSGAAAASAFGAGFGGSAWALIEASAAESFLEAWADSYRSRFPEDACNSTFFTTGAGPAAFQLS